MCGTRRPETAGRLYLIEVGELVEIRESTAATLLTGVRRERIAGVHGGGRLHAPRVGVRLRLRFAGLRWRRPRRWAGLFRRQFGRRFVEVRSGAEWIVEVLRGKWMVSQNRSGSTEIGLNRSESIR